MIGQIIAGKYRITQLIGSGGMAHVYQATQLASPHRTVAIKLLKDEFNQDASFVRRFDLEAQAVVGLSHENIVRSYDAGQEDDLHYIVLEYVEGVTLKEYVRDKGRLQPRTVVNMGAQVLDALAHAHEKGFIHRDVKPQNVIVTPRGKLKLADFGIARNTSADHTQTFAGTSVLGSAHYLSPEQAKGQTAVVESDLYSMGVLLYEMCTGRVPFEGDNTVSIALRHIQDDPIPPIELNPALAPALNDIILKAMQKDPALRYHDAKEMRRDLMRVLREPTGDYAKVQPADGPGTPKKKRRHRGVFRIALVTVIVVGLFVTLFLIGSSLLSRENTDSELVPTLIELPFEQAQEKAYKRGYTVTITQTVSSDVYEQGIVILQSPVAGSKLKKGGTISLVVSGGPAETALMPHVVSLPLFEAEQAVLAAGLNPIIEYRASDRPEGTVYQQNPAAETPLLRGEDVELFVSGEPVSSTEAPTVMGLPLEDALRLLHENGLSRLFVYTAGEPAPDTQAGLVVRQNPAQGEPVQSDLPVFLTVSAREAAAYTATISCSLNVPQNDMTFLAVVKRESGGVPYHYIVYSETLRAGEDRELEFLARSDSPGAAEVLFLLDGNELARSQVTFLLEATTE